MNKKVLAVSLASVAAIATSFAFIIGGKGIHIEAAKAAAKTIVFDKDTNCLSEGKHDSTTYNAVSANTEDAIVTEAWGYSGFGYEKAYFGGDYYMSLSDEVSARNVPSLRLEIGVNGLTSFTIVYGTTTAESPVFSGSLKDADGNELKSIGDSYGSASVAGENTKNVLVSDLSISGTVRSVYFDVYGWGSGWAEHSIYIKSITLNWSC